MAVLITTKQTRLLLTLMYIQIQTKFNLIFVVPEVCVTD